MTPDAADADAIAIEHLLWAKEVESSPADVLTSIGVGWPCPRPPSWHDAQFALAIRWREMQRSRLKLTEVSGEVASIDELSNCSHQG